MAYYFLDTSGLVKYYHAEAGSSRIIALVDDPDNAIFVSRLSLIELPSSFVRKVRTRELNQSTFERLLKRFFADLRARRFRIVRWTAYYERQAIRLLLQHGIQSPLRTLDALQLAVAFWLRGQNFLDHFVCADAQLCAVAQQAGLSVINPERP